MLTNTFGKEVQANFDQDDIDHLTWTQTPAARWSLLVRYRPRTASKFLGDLQHDAQDNEYDDNEHHQHHHCHCHCDDCATCQRNILGPPRSKKCKAVGDLGE